MKPRRIRRAAFLLRDSRFQIRSRWLQRTVGTPCPRGYVPMPLADSGDISLAVHAKIDTEN